MGSGSSKSGNQSSRKEDVPKSPQKPVANVNKHDDGGKQKDKNISADSKHEQDLNSSSRSPKKSSEPIITDVNSKSKEGKNRNGKRNNALFTSSNYDGRIQFEDDSDFEDDLDEVLKIPTAASNYSKKDKNKEQKKRDRDKENEYEHDFQSNISQQYLPETYAQRLQRKQYKLQQDVLIREKTIVRNPQEWDSDDDEKDDYKVLENASPSRGFDASKFRAVNKGDVKTNDFATVSNDLKTPRYLQPTGQSLDDVDLNKKEDLSLYKQSPKYNQAELDLMHQLEEELL